MMPTLKPVFLAALLLPSGLLAQATGPVLPQSGTATTAPVVVPPLPQADAATPYLLASPYTASAPADPMPRQAIFVYGGQYTSASLGETILFQRDNDRVSNASVGYQCYPWSWGDFNIGVEIGLANRFGRGAYSLEGWAGPTARYDGLVLFDYLKIAPSFTAGFSVVTKAMGEERAREVSRHGNATFLGYLAPELALSTATLPNLEVFYRVHHRSGAGGVLGNICEGYNASVIGVRYKF